MKKSGATSWNAQNKKWAINLNIFEFISPKIKKTKEVEIQNLKISVRDLSAEDISTRKLEKISGGVVITDISNTSPLKGLANINDIIIEAKRTPIEDTSDLKNVVNKIVKKGEKNLLLLIVIFGFPFVIVQCSDLYLCF